MKDTVIMLQTLFPDSKTFQIPSFQTMQRATKQLNDLTVQRRSQCTHTCRTERYKKNRDTCQHGHPYLKEPMYVLDIIPQIQHALAKHTWSELLSSVTGSDPEHITYNIRDSPRYKLKMNANTPYQVIPYIISSDGVSVHTKKFQKNHQMWPFFLDLILTPFPHDYALIGLLCGPKHPKNPTNAFQHVRRKLQKLDRFPFPVTDRLGVTRMCVGRCLLQVCDGPGHNKLLGLVGAGSYDVCRFCDRKFTLFSGTMIDDNIRAFLPLDHKLRSDPRFGEPTAAPLPRPKTNAFFDVWSKAAAALNTNLPFKRDLRHLNGVKYEALLRKLFLWDSAKDAPLDIMHLVSNLMAHIKEVMTGENNTKLPVFEPPARNSNESHTDYARRCNAMGEAFLNDPNYVYLCDVIQQEKLWLLSKAEQGELDRRYRTIRTHKGLKGLGLPFGNGKMTTANWYFFIKYCSTWIFEGLVVPIIFDTLKRMFDIFRYFLRHQQRREWFDWYEQSIIESLCEVSLVFPKSHHSLWFHNILHMVQCMRQWGPCYHYSMMRFERHVGTLVGTVTRHTDPEANVIERWKVAQRNSSSLVRWHTGLVSYLYANISRAVSTFYPVSALSRRMGERTNTLCVDGRRKYRTSRYDRSTISLHVARHRDLFGLGDVNLSVSDFNDNFIVCGEYRYAMVDGRLLGSVKSESPDVEGSTCASAFISVPDMHHHVHTIPVDVALAGQAHRFVRCKLTIPSTNEIRCLDVCEVSLYKWSRTDDENDRPEFRIDVRRGTYTSVSYLPLMLIDHTVMLIDDPCTNGSSLRYVIAFDSGFVGEIE